jgi:hypothetical protein
MYGSRPRTGVWGLDDDPHAGPAETKPGRDGQPEGRADERRPDGHVPLISSNVVVFSIGVLGLAALLVLIRNVQAPTRGRDQRQLRGILLSLTVG